MGVADVGFEVTGLFVGVADVGFEVTGLFVGVAVTGFFVGDALGFEVTGGALPMIVILCSVPVTLIFKSMYWQKLKLCKRVC